VNLPLDDLAQVEAPSEIEVPYLMRPKMTDRQVNYCYSGPILLKAKTPTYPCGSLALCFSFFSAMLSAQQGLAPSVQADLLRDKIYAQAKAHDADGMLTSLDQYHKLDSDYNLAFPVPLLRIEAKAAHDANDLFFGKPVRLRPLP